MDFYLSACRHLNMYQHFFEETHFWMSFAPIHILALKCRHFFSIQYLVQLTGLENCTREADLHRGKKIR